MISIIICSRDNDLLSSLKLNIKRTAGCDYELIVVGNANEFTGIGAAYNYGLKQAKGNIVCFCHEDILFETDSWGRLVSEYLEKNTDIGLLGIAGSTFKSQLPTAWIYVPENLYRTSIINLSGDPPVPSLYIVKESDNAVFSKTVTLDGCFLCGRMQVFTQISWNEQIGGFHLYDIDISQRIGIKYTVGVFHNIVVSHLSEGSFDKAWLKSTLNYHNKYGISNTSTIPVTEHEKYGYDLHGFNSLVVVMAVTRSYRYFLQLWLQFVKLYPNRMSSYYYPPLAWLRLSRINQFRRKYSGNA